MNSIRYFYHTLQKITKVPFLRHLLHEAFFTYVRSIILHADKPLTSSLLLNLTEDKTNWRIVNNQNINKLIHEKSEIGSKVDKWEKKYEAIVFCIKRLMIVDSLHKDPFDYKYSMQLLDKLFPALDKIEQLIPWKYNDVSVFREALGKLATSTNEYVKEYGDVAGFELLDRFSEILTVEDVIKVQ